MALAFLVHFVGDLHQPMHAGDRGDLGGNGCAVSYGVIPTNLHAIWDGYLADRGISQPPGDAAGILSEAERRRTAPPMRAGHDRRLVARKLGGGARIRLRHDPRRPLRAAGRHRPADRPVIAEAITRRLIPIVRRQVARGGLRLARLLDEAFQPDSPWLRPRGAAAQPE